MVQLTCPWCEMELCVTLAVLSEEVCCPECRTVWLLEGDDEQFSELAAAA